MTSDDIYRQFRDGRLEAFYQNTYPGLIVWASRVLGAELSFLAEDCVQDAIFETYQNLSAFRSASHWRVFLYTCVRNRAISLCRRRQTENNFAALAQETDKQAESVEKAIVAHEVEELLMLALASLPEKERELFRLSCELGMRNADIAARLGLAEITIKKQKSHLLQTLRRLLRGVK